MPYTLTLSIISLPGEKIQVDFKSDLESRKTHMGKLEGDTDSMGAFVGLLAFADTVMRVTGNPNKFELRINHPKYGSLSGDEYVKKILHDTEPDVMEIFARIRSSKDIPQA